MTQQPSPADSLDQPQCGLRNSLATPDQMRALLQDACDAVGSQKEWARLNKVSDAYVSDVLHGRRDVSDTICEALGYERIVSFRRRT